MTQHKRRGAHARKLRQIGALQRLEATLPELVERRKKLHLDTKAYPNDAPKNVLEGMYKQFDALVARIVRINAEITTLKGRV